MIHKGEIIEKAVRNSGVSLTYLAKELNFSRRHIYNIFDNYNVPTPLILKIGKIINYDFSNDIKALHPFIERNSKTDYKEKYFELLEKYNQLLEEYKSKK